MKSFRKNVKGEREKERKGVMIMIIVIAHKTRFICIIYMTKLYQSVVLQVQISATFMSVEK